MFLTTTLILTSTLVFAGQQKSDDAPVKSPQVTQMEPRAGKPGTVIEIKGVSLGKDEVDEVYLTDHRFDLKVKVIEQTGDKLKIRIPPFIKPGRQQLLLLTGGKNPTYLEQPVWIQVEDGGDDKEVVAQKDAPAATKESAAGDGNKPDKPEDR